MEEKMKNEKSPNKEEKKNKNIKNIYCILIYILRDKNNTKNA